ncbi:MAG TPA: sodium-dependent bicarbonate transport family permease [Gemmatimonadaceae bacterium]|nr:sodium-dependent bicarbonate transport family permease [Gemmatimonadaceae bacterium]
MAELIRANLLSPIVLAFALGVVAKLIRSEFTLPKDLYVALSIYLLFAIGLKGGVELSQTPLSAFVLPAVVTLAVGVLTPVLSYVALRQLGRFSVADSAGIAAHYGSVSAVTFIAAQEFVASAGTPAEGFMPTLLTLLEAPGIHVALAIGVVQASRGRLAAAQLGTGASLPAGSDARPRVSHAEHAHWRETLRAVLTGRTMVLLVGGLIIGALIGERGWEPVRPFFEGGFRGVLTLFLLEMGLLAAERLGDLKRVGVFLLGFGTVMPLVNGAIGVALGHWAGLSPGGAAVLGTMAASASYIAAPPAVRLALPEANPTYYLTLALGVTFPFNLILGIPAYHQMALWLAR